MFVPQIRHYQELQRERAAMEEKIRLEEDILLHLRQKQQRLQHDPRFVERIVREELGYAKPGETVFRFVDEDLPGDTGSP